MEGGGGRDTDREVGGGRGETHRQRARGNGGGRDTDRELEGMEGGGGRDTDRE